MAQDDVKPAVPIGLKRHAGIIGQRSLGDDGVSCAAGKLACYRRGQPLAGGQLVHVVFLIRGFVMPFKSVMPNGASARKHKDTVFIWNAGILFVRGNNKTESNAVVVCPRFQSERGIAGLVPERQRGAPAMIDGLRMDAPVRIGVVNFVGLALDQFNIVGELDVVDGHDQCGAFDHRLVVESGGVD